MLNKKNSYIFLAENRIKTQSDGMLNLKHSIAFGLDEIQLESIFLNPKTNYISTENFATILTYIGDLTIDNQVIIEENTLISLLKTNSISNHYDSDAINFIRFYSSKNQLKNQINYQISIEDLSYNCFTKPFKFDTNIHLRLGKFKGKFDTIIEEETDFLAFIIEGAFEIEGCLLETGDALLLQNFKNIEIESLSAEAIVIVFSKIIV